MTNEINLRYVIEMYFTGGSTAIYELPLVDEHSLIEIERLLLTIKKYSYHSIRNYISADIETEATNLQLKLINSAQNLTHKILNIGNVLVEEKTSPELEKYKIREQISESKSPTDFVNRCEKGE